MEEFESDGATPRQEGNYLRAKRKRQQERKPSPLVRQSAQRDLIKWFGVQKETKKEKR